MEAWRQWPLGGRRKRAYQKQTKITLTPTGLLMEGDYTKYEVNECNGDVAPVETIVGGLITSGWPTNRPLSG
jgi:hypothetical protein